MTRSARIRERNRQKKLMVEVIEEEIIIPLTALLVLSGVLVLLAMLINYVLIPYFEPLWK